MKNNHKEITIPTIEQTVHEIERLKRKNMFKHSMSTIIITIIVVIAVTVSASTFFFPVVQVSGSSMEPTLYAGDYLVMIKADKFKTGDICGFYWQNKLLIKRVIAAGGSVVNIDEDGTVTVDGQRLSETYIKEKSVGYCDIQFPYVVPQEKYFVMGDDRGTSVDSRSSTIGCIDKEQVVGRLLFRAWPLR